MIRVETIGNFKNGKPLALPNLTNIVVIVGKNNVGKTTLLNRISKDWRLINPWVMDSMFFIPCALKANLPIKKLKHKDRPISLFIDEIENGLDVETMKKLTDDLIDICRNDIRSQIFLTTHSLEFLDFLSMSANKKQYWNIVVLKLSETRTKEVQVSSYNAGKIRNMLQNKIEFRY